MTMGCCTAIIVMVLIAFALQGLWYLLFGRPLFKPYGDGDDDKIFPFPYD